MIDRPGVDGEFIQRSIVVNSFKKSLKPLHSQAVRARLLTLLQNVYPFKDILNLVWLQMFGSKIMANWGEWKGRQSQHRVTTCS